MRQLEKKTPVRVDKFLAGQTTDRGGVTNQHWCSTDPGSVTPSPEGGSSPDCPRHARALGGMPPLLGNTAKIQATRIHAGSKPIGLETINLETGEIITVSPAGKIILGAAASRIERYALQSVVRDLLPSSRTSKCLRLPHRNSAGVEVWRSPEFQRAHYGGLQTCASVWACPVCTAKISERRRAELQVLIAAHESIYGAGTVVLVTRTFPHQRTDNLGELLVKFAQAEASYKAHRDYKTLAKAIGIVGTVKAIEVTYGNANGFHPHGHELVFLTHLVKLEDLEEELSRIWIAAALRAGFPHPSRAHGLSVQGGSHAANYASKWGLESELTQWHRKRGKIESKTPFDFLRDVLYSDDSRSGFLFKEYAAEFHGRHQLQFSRGLKNRYQIEEIADDELARRQDADALLLGKINPEQWRLVCQTGHRGTLLEVAGAIGWDGVVQLLEGLGKPNSTADKSAR